MSSGPQTTTSTEKTKSSGFSSGSSSQTGTTAGTATSNVTLPDYLQGLVQGLPGMTEDQLAGLSEAVSGFEVDPTAMAAVSGTAAGDYLYGGPAQDAFIQAAVNKALPAIHSTFRSGRGLAEHAVGQSAIDAYAGLYDAERNRQMQAAQLLPQFQQMPIALQNQLLGQTLQVPNAFAQLYGKTGATTGTTSSKGTNMQMSSQKGTGTTTQQLYQDPMSQWLGLGLGLLSVV